MISKIFNPSGDGVSSPLTSLHLSHDGQADDTAHGIIGNSLVLRSVLDQIGVVAPTDSTVLILGETGTGKELAARAIHKLSLRRNAPFVTLNCAAIPAGLLESELFGHERGAFTGAVTRRIGRFETASGGTLFLDEIGDMPLELQVKLLRVLQEKEFERLGSARSSSANVRLVAATNRNLLQMVDDKSFRADLYYRLNVFPILLPSLRERPEDIPVLVGNFVAKYAQQMNKAVETISLETMDAMLSYNWPGNIRELQNFIERGVIISRTRVFQPDLDQIQHHGIKLRYNRQTLDGAIRKHILQILDEVNWVIGGQHGAATRLGIPRTTLIAKMQRLGIESRAAVVRGAEATRKEAFASASQ